jgi:hypothetical protein
MGAEQNSSNMSEPSATGAKRIYSQVVASSGPVISGHAIPNDVIRRLFDHMPKESVLHQHHDRSLPPAGKLFNKRLEEREDGTVAILADVELANGVDLNQFGGFSVSYAGRLLTPSENESPPITIYLDMRYFDEDDLRGAVGASPGGEEVGARELYRYSLGFGATVVIISVGFVSYEYAKGFFGEAGKETFRFVKQTLSDLAKKQRTRGNTTSLEFGFPVKEDGGGSYEVIVRAREEDFFIVDSGLISLEDLRHEVQTVFDANKVEKVVATLATTPPYLRLMHGVPRPGASLELEGDTGQAGHRNAAT